MWLMIVMLNCNNNDQILFEREVSNNSIKLNSVTELLIHRIPSNRNFQSGLHLLRAVYSCLLLVNRDPSPIDS